MLTLILINKEEIIIMADSITVQEGFYEKIDNIHCGVVRGFKIHCGGEMKVLGEEEEFLFERSGITAKRGDGEVVFSR